MKKYIVYIALLSVALTVSLIGNGFLYSEVRKLRSDIQKLTEQDQATARAEEFVKLLLGNPSKESEKKIRKITTEKAQKKIFSTEEPHDDLEEGISQNLTIDQTYFNRDSLEQVHVIIKGRIMYQLENTSTMSEYEMKVYLARVDTGVWKIDNFELISIEE
ncbi:hypothetical protein NYE37_13770 [Thermoactinomyces sp. FSL K6-2592]|uniref:hypothetical protein n=1 Tax=Thermoactinomyces sp. FSL K6-2592 TaxID=2975347 RepID=UPI0030F94863